MNKQSIYIQWNFSILKWNQFRRKEKKGEREGRRGGKQGVSEGGKKKIYHMLQHG